MTSRALSRGGMRGFLFSDLRGYTAFIERRGAKAAAALLDRYRPIVRSTVSEFAGAEIRTEGDSFYIVFADASSAVTCGLAIIAAADEANAQDPELPIRVGIGVHAGETVQTDEGYVGTVVNIAARLCALAGAGEVLVSDTVRAVTAGITEVRYDPRGRHRLKGVSDPVLIFRAMAADSPALRTRRLAIRRPPSLAASQGGKLLLLFTAILIVGAMVVALGGGWSWLGGVASPGLSASPRFTDPSVNGPPGSTPADDSGIDFPSDEERTLLGLIPDADQDRCERAALADVPILNNTVRAGIPPRDFTRPTPLGNGGGIVCSLGGISAPDSVWYWSLNVTGSGGEWMAQQAGQVGAQAGICSEATPAVERWSFGGQTGHLLCYTTTTGDAVLAWDYDNSKILGRAVRDDQDMAAALQWWADNARFGPSQ